MKKSLVTGKKFHSAFLLLLIRHRFHENNLCTDVFSDLFNLEFSEMGCFNLELAAGNRNNAVFGRLYTFSDFLAFSYIDLHTHHLLRQSAFLFISIVPERNYRLIYQLVYIGL